MRPKFLAVLLLILLSALPGPVQLPTTVVAGGAAPGFFIEQGGAPLAVAPMSNGEDIVDFYAYDTTKQFSADTGLERDDASLIFLWEDQTGVSLVFIHERFGDPDGGAVDVSLSGLPTDGRWVVTDDPPVQDFDSDVDMDVRWAWQATYTDGGAFQGTWEENMLVTITTAWDQAASRWGDLRQPAPVARWLFLSGDPASPTEIELTKSLPLVIVTDVPGGPLDARLDEHDLDVHLRWSPAAPSDTGIRLLRGTSPTSLVVVQMLAPSQTMTTDRPGPTCSSVAWGQAFYWAVEFVGPGGGSRMTDVKSVVPCSRTHLLDVLNENYEFYWGPTSTDNDNGPPGVGAPGNLSAFDDHAGELAQWFGVPPVVIACCEPIILDKNALRPSEGEVYFSLADWALGVATWAEPLREVWEDFTENTEVRGTFTGVRFQDRPYLDPDRNDYATVSREQGFSAYATVLGTGLSPVEAEVGGSLFLDEERSVFDTGDLPEDVQITVPLPTFDKEFSGAEFSFKFIGLQIKGETDFEIEVLAEPQFFIDLRSSPPVPGLLEVGAKVVLEGTLEAELEAEARRCGAEGEVEGTLGIDFVMDHVIRLPGGPTERWSPILEAHFEDIGPYTLVQRIGPVTLGADASLEAGCGWFRPEFSLKKIPFVRDLFKDRDIAPLFIVYGPTDVVASEGKVVELLSIGSAGVQTAFGAGTGSLATAPDAFETLFEVQGEPGNVTDLVVSRAVAYVAPNGTTAIAPLTVTVPGVEIGPAGSAVLRLDVAEMLSSVRRSSAAGASKEAAFSAAAEALDLNGDGASDLQAGGAPYDARVPVKLVVDWQGPDGFANLAYVGEKVNLTVRPENAMTGAQVVPSGDRVVEVWANGTLAVQIPVGVDGVARWQDFMPLAFGPGSHPFEILFAGDAQYRAAKKTLDITVQDREPRLDLSLPEMFDAINRTTGLALKIEGTATPSLDLQVESLIAVIDNETVVPLSLAANGTFAGVLDVGPFGLELPDGEHSLHVRAEDLARNQAAVETRFVVDQYRPAVATDKDPPVARAGESYVVRWTADEEVVSRLRYAFYPDYDLAGPVEHGNMTIDTPSYNGALEIEDLQAGFYEYWLEFRDLGGSFAPGFDGRRLVVVLPEQEPPDDPIGDLPDPTELLPEPPSPPSPPDGAPPVACQALRPFLGGTAAYQQLC